MTMSTTPMSGGIAPVSSLAWNAGRGSVSGANNSKPTSSSSLDADDATYLRTLSSYSMARLEREPRVLRDQQQQIQQQMEQIAVSNYRTFVESAECVHEAHQTIAEIDSRLGVLIDSLPQFVSKANEFSSKTQDVRASQQLNRLMLDNQVVLLELLEIPQLMETCGRSGLFDEALDLFAYAQLLVQRHPDVAILHDLFAEMHRTKASLVQQLIQMLSGQLQLSVCLRVVSHLRRLNEFSETVLRRQFLHSRNAWLDHMITSIPESASPYEHLSRYLDLHRVHLFDIVTQYRAIFVDDTSAAEEPQQSHDRGLLLCWISNRVSALLERIELLLPRVLEGSFVNNLLEQCMYCGASLSRVGVDFRTLLPPIFESCILHWFEGLVAIASETFHGALIEFDWSLSTAECAKLGIQRDKNAELMAFPPLVVLANVYIHALNKIRHCALVALQGRIVAAVEKSLAQCVNVLRRGFVNEIESSNSNSGTNNSSNGHAHSKSSSTTTQKQEAIALARAYAHVLLPFVHELVVGIFGRNSTNSIVRTTSFAKVHEQVTLLYVSEEEVAKSNTSNSSAPTTSTSTTPANDGIKRPSQAQPPEATLTPPAAATNEEQSELATTSTDANEEQSEPATTSTDANEEQSKPATATADAVVDEQAQPYAQTTA